MNDDFLLQRERRRLATLTVVCTALVAGALYLQYAERQDPCPLCILQRYGYLLAALFACVGARARGWRGIAVAETLVLLAAAGGGAAAARQVWLQSHPSFSCGFDALQPIVDALPPAKLLPSVFKVAGLCDTPYPPILGITLPQWSLLAFALIFLLVARSLLRRAASLR